MQLNEGKCNYIVFSRSKTTFATRLSINNNNLERITATKLLGVCLTEDMSWSKNCKEMCIKAFQTVHADKVKVCEDMLDVYKLYIRSVY